MPFMYDAIHNTVRRYEEDEDDRVIEDGKRIRVPMTMMDSMQRSIAGSVATLDGDVQLVSRQELADWDKAQLSARWKNGLQDGDTFRLGERMVTVQGRNPATGKVVLRDASTSADGRQEAYDSYDAEIQSRYLNTHDAAAGESCVTAGREPGRWREREKDGRLVCVPSGKPDEWAIAGPLSDAERVQIKDRMYASYDDQIQNAWRK
jgi:hypothetical protein